MIGYISWNPDRVAFSLPYVDFPIYWYSIFFAIGLYGAIYIARTLMKARAVFLVGTEYDRSLINHYIEWLALYAFIGILIGARLGHVIFYDLAHHLAHPIDILNLRLGGLSSHGAIIGLLIALRLFSKREYAESYIPKGYNLLDLIAVSSAWVAGAIRIGNFFNQEIVGLPTSVPWAIIFVSPLDASGGIPRHPTQLYEAIVAFSLLILLLLITRMRNWATNGRITGWYLLITFSMRCLIEQFKVPQCGFDTGTIHMGQLLSIPLLLFALFLIYPNKSKN